MRYQLEGLDCANCAAKIERELQKIEGLEAVKINFVTKNIELPEDKAELAKNAISEIEPDIKLVNIHESQKVIADTKNQKFAMIFSAILFIAGIIFETNIIPLPDVWVKYSILIPAYILVGWPVIFRAFRQLVKGRLFDENFLMTVATLGAIAIQQLTEAVGVMLFYAIGEYFQEKAVNRSRRSIAALMNIQPEYANLREDGITKKVKPQVVDIGQVIIVKPGEKVPLDGEVIEGGSFADTSALTGESLPREVQKGDLVLAGMINGQGLLLVKVTKKYEDSSVAKILTLVEHAAERKAATEQFITRFSYYYTPAVVTIAALLSIVPPLFWPGNTFGDWFYRALVLLVISCPCALMVSIPLGYFGGIGEASRHGILVKGANFLDALSRLHTVVFDKTGTLTKGIFRVDKVFPEVGFTPEQVIAAAAGAGIYSNHPIAQSIQRMHGKEIALERISQFVEVPGFGTSAMVDGKKVLLGNDRLLHQEKISHELCEIEGTNVRVVIDDVYAGYITITDEIKEDAKSAIVKLRQEGVKQIFMLTGDTAHAAAQVAEELKLDKYYAELLPEAKVKKVEEIECLLNNRKNQKMAFVGDGINDAPVIAKADIGIAMGGLGSDAAIEAADVVLMEDSPAKLATAVAIAKRTRSLVGQNIIMALGVKLFFIILGIVGVADIWEAVFADVGVTLIAVFNASRIHIATMPQTMKC